MSTPTDVKMIFFVSVSARIVTFFATWTTAGWSLSFIGASIDNILVEVAAQAQYSEDYIKTGGTYMWTILRTLWNILLRQCENQSSS